MKVYSVARKKYRPRKSGKMTMNFKKSETVKNVKKPQEIIPDDMKSMVSVNYLENRNSSDHHNEDKNIVPVVVQARKKKTTEFDYDLIPHEPIKGKEDQFVEEMDNKSTISDNDKDILMGHVLPTHYSSFDLRRGSKGNDQLETKTRAFHILERTFDPTVVNHDELDQQKMKYCSQIISTKKFKDQKMNKSPYLSRSGENLHFAESRKSVRLEVPSDSRTKLNEASERRGSNYSTPNQRLDDAIRGLKKNYEELSNELEHIKENLRNERLSLAKDRENLKKYFRGEIETEKSKADQCEDAKNAIRLGLISTEQKYESTLAQYNSLEKKISHEDIALQEWFLIMYEKGKTTVYFENRIEFQLSNDTDLNYMECKKEFVMYLRETRRRLKKWKRDRLQEHYETFNQRISGLEGKYGKTKVIKLGFIRDSLLHFIMAKNNKEAYTHLTMLVNLFRYTGSQLKRVISALVRMQKEGLC